MFVIIGLVIVLACVLGSFVAMGGKLGVLWQPFEYVIIVGAGIGAFVIGNPMKIVKGSIGAAIAALKGPVYKKEHYLELLSCLFELFKLAKQQHPKIIEAFERPIEVITSDGEQ